MAAPFKPKVSNDGEPPCSICGSPVYIRKVAQPNLATEYPSYMSVRTCTSRRCPSNTGEASLAEAP
jgi:hypothetical protein